MNMGYACINMTLSSGKDKVSTNRTMRKSTFQQKGLALCFRACVG
jgi:hypothetical protein